MNVSKNISFGKTLVATCQIPTLDEKDSCCKIFELNNVEDKDYFSNLNKSKNWSGNSFVWVMERLMSSKSIGKGNDTYSLENSAGECLGYINVISHEKPYNKKFIQYLEAIQNNVATLTKQSLVAFIVEQAKKENKDEVTTLIFNKDARKFFKRECGFKLGTEDSYDFILNKKHYRKFLEKYKQKTNSEITFIA